MSVDQPQLDFHSGGHSAHKKGLHMGIADKSHFFIEQELIEIIYCQYYPAIWGVISDLLPVEKRIFFFLGPTV